MAVRLNSLDPLVDALRADGYQVIGPRVRDGAVVLDELTSAAQLPYGWDAALEPGGYRLRERPDGAAFAAAGGPQSWKSYLHPAHSELLRVRRDEDEGLVVQEPARSTPRYAFLGVRACDLRAIAIQDRVLGVVADSGYARRRRAAFIVAVNCTHPGETCFCASAGAGPAVGPGYDLALTELTAPREPDVLPDPDHASTAGSPTRYLVESGSERGGQMLDRLPVREAEPADEERARSLVAAAAQRMTRTLPPVDLRSLLAGTLESPRWDDVAQRCLSCGNCTMVCPTCFCTTVEEAGDLAPDASTRWSRWDSCFDLDFSYLHGGPVRATTRSRYRQWLTHKLGTWHDQFGESGCVGCGRCIVWCPVGIDLTVETAALAAGGPNAEAEDA